MSFWVFYLCRWWYMKLVEVDSESESESGLVGDDCLLDVGVSHAEKDQEHDWLL